MSVVNRNSNTIANAVAVPRVPNSPGVGGEGILREVAGVVATATDDSQNSIHRFCRLPSNARVSQVLLSCIAAGSAGAVDVGLYQTVERGGAVVDADLFGSAVALTSGNKDNLDVTYESGEYTITESLKPLWEVLGLTEDPCIEYDLATTITTTFSSGPTAMALKARYVR